MNARSSNFSDQPDVKSLGESPAKRAWEAPFVSKLGMSGTEGGDPGLVTEFAGYSKCTVDSVAAKTVTHCYWS